MATPCTSTFSSLLFTPYGDKFENGDGRIRETYRRNSLKYPLKNPWLISVNGYIRVDESTIKNLGKWGEFWSQTTLNLNQSHRIMTNDWDLFPAAYTDRFVASSVRKE